MPKVSIILSSYNHEKFIAASIESVLNQTFQDFELLIFDDGSQDNSREIIKSFDDSRIKFFPYEKNRGSYFAFQELLKISSGKYVAFQHSDDIWGNTKLEKQVDFLDKNPNYEVCFTLAKFIDEYGENYELPENHAYKNVFNQKNRPREEWLNHLFWKSNCFCNPSALIRNKPKNFPTTPDLSQLPDYFMWVNICLKKSPYVLQEELINFRLRRENQISTSSINIEKTVRISNEIYFVAKLFLNLLRDEKFFLKVFPEAEKFLINGKISTEFAFAQLCLKRELPAFQKLALEILYDLLHNKAQCALIKKLYNYDEKNFTQDTGKFDVFGLRAQLQILKCKLYFDLGEDFNENDTVENPTLIRPDGNFTAVFDFVTDSEILKFRFDPDDKAALSIKIIKISVNGKIISKFDSNAFQVADDYFNFVTADPFFVINEKFSDKKIHVEISGAVKNDALSNFEKKYFQQISSIRQLENNLQEKISQIQNKDSQIQQLENSVQDKISQIQQLENSVQDKISQIQQLENSVQDKNSQIQQLENSVQDKISQIQQLENIKAAQSEQIANLQNIQNEILNSNSWKITRPLRFIGRIIRNHR